MSNTQTPEPVQRLTRWVGDLDHPFYDDERVRWVWYEASAIGLQAALLGTYVMAGLALLLAATDPGWTMLMVLPVTIGALIAIGHASANSADYAISLIDVRRPRGLAGLGAVAFFLASYLIRIALDGDPIWAVACGLLFVGALAATVIQGRRQQARADAANEAADDSFDR